MKTSRLVLIHTLTFFFLALPSAVNTTAISVVPDYGLFTVNRYLAYMLTYLTEWVVYLTQPFLFSVSLIFSRQFRKALFIDYLYVAPVSSKTNHPSLKFGVCHPKHSSPLHRGVGYGTGIYPAVSMFVFRCLWTEEKVALNLSAVSYDALLQALGGILQTGGRYSPGTCKALEKVALIIPYRDREKNLHILLRNLVPFLVRQQLEFTIFVVEQVRRTGQI
ncbi:hypothetical protein C0Q70_18308 [Pomacea canaliculata]|uniref:Galactosyltransferase N-terminal domain-containing protein n=1 Tax=Pomacea canaliculata TaxID=400727 RepID=A0A2T7NMW1_POMCA|nr:hypothetical protein C0Q70_18308 [Pomacea canaliculata]